MKKLLAKQPHHGAGCIDTKRVKFVYCHPQTGRWWCHKINLGSTFATLGELISALESCKKGRAFLAKHGKSKAEQRIKTEDLVNRVRCLAAYTLSGSRRWFPADVHSRERLAASKRGQQMFKKEPALHIISLQLRMWPWKDALVSEWRRVDQSPKGRDQTLESRVSKIRTVLLKCAIRMSKHPVSQQWQSNAIRNQWRVAGPVSWPVEKCLYLLGACFGTFQEWLKSIRFWMKGRVFGFG